MSQQRNNYKIWIAMVVFATTSSLLGMIFVWWAPAVNYPITFLTAANTTPHSLIMEVKSAGVFLERIQQFNFALESIRLQAIFARGGLKMVWQNEMSANTRVINGARDNFMSELETCHRIMTVVLPWHNDQNTGPHVESWNSLTDFSNVLYQIYYEWTADNTLCEWIETPGIIKLKFDIFFNFTCNRNINATVKPRSLAPIFLNGKPLLPDQYWPNDGKFYPAHFYTDPPAFVTYLFIHTDAIVTPYGNVFSKSCKLVQYSCGHDLSKALPEKVDSLPIYDEVFVTSHYWGSSTFHRMVEIMPRVALQLKFLRSNPQIRIAAVESDGGRLAELLRIVGLNSSRLVKGSLRGKVVYHPRSTGCGFANVQESQVLHKLYQDYITMNFPSQSRNRLLLIRRSRLRKFNEQQAIEEVVERLALQYKLNFTVFRDDPTPSLNDTMNLFHSAAIVVAPHGAGLSNLFFSQRGTYVIEGVCNLPHVNLCLHRIIHILGHHWHGLTSRGGCEGVVDVAASEVESALRSYLHLYDQESDTRAKFV